MTAIEKAKEALIIQHNTLHLIIDILKRHDPVTKEFSVEFAKVDAKYSEALAALEAEKPAEDIRDVAARCIDDLWHCGRVWSAWSYGTMGQDDFSAAAEDENVIDNVMEIIQQYAEAYHEKMNEVELDDLRHGREPDSRWKPMESAPWDREVLLTGASGYMAPHELFYINGYRIKDWHNGEWNDATGTRLIDNGWTPTKWMKIPE